MSTPQTPHSSPSQWLRLPQVLERTKTGKTWLYDRMKDKEDPFPAGVLFSARMRVWDAAEVDAWMKRQHSRSSDPTTQP